MGGGGAFIVQLMYPPIGGNVSSICLMTEKKNTVMGSNFVAYKLCEFKIC